MGFRLTENFLAKYMNVEPPFGFGELGKFTYYRTYSRFKEDGTREEWWETVKRVVAGIYTIQQDYIEEQNLGWDAREGQYSAQEMYDRMFNLKFLPGGRGLWAMGTDLVMKKGLFGALHNCTYATTDFTGEEIPDETARKYIKEDPVAPFRFFMDMCMLGSGVGFDVRGANKLGIKGPDRRRKEQTMVIPDTREGWVDSVGELIESYIHGTAMLVFDYSEIRPKGTPLKTFGGVASGPEPLKELHERLRELLDGYVGKQLDARGIVDVMNLIGRCVVSGNIRRTASIALGNPDDDEYLDLKNYSLYPERADYGWVSNNSVLAELGMDYSDIARRIVMNGEPGVVWLENCRKYSRLIDPPDWKDEFAMGVNPCGEQTLHPFESCNLVELYLNRHDSLDDFLRSIKFAYLFGKSVTLGTVHNIQSNRAMLRNRRIGCSVSGVVQFMRRHGMGVLREWLTKGYDEIQKRDHQYSNWLAIPLSIKTTTVKPSGTTSLLVGATPGVHFPVSRYYIRRIRLASDDELIPRMVKAGYKVEPVIEADGTESDITSVVEFPVDCGETLVGNNGDEQSMWQQLSLAESMQECWSDNGVSVTCTFDPDKISATGIAVALDYFQYKLKGVTFLPQKQITEYKQMPYEVIDEGTYNKAIGKLRPVDYSGLGTEASGDKYCNSDTCEVG